VIYLEGHAFQKVFDKKIRIATALGRLAFGIGHLLHLRRV